MSAIVAVVSPGLGEEDRRWLEDATACSRRAGPDGSAFGGGERWGLGHALLRTSPRDVAQPVSLDDLSLTGDVRLDARDELAAALGVDPAADDAQLVLHAYRRWGDACVERLAGDFAFACWDARRQRLFCARDQLGVAPLHYARADRRLLVASVPDALLTHPAVPDALDERWIASFLVIGLPPDHAATVFASVRLLPPAHTMTWEDGIVRLRRYWRLPRWEPLVRFRRPEEYAERFRALLDAAVADRLTDDRVAVHLSGGMDSTSVAASAQATLRARGAPDGSIRAITIGLGGSTGDREPEFAAVVAERLGLVYDLVEEASATVTDPLAAPPTPNAEPVHYATSAVSYALATMPARHARVAFTGHGGDAVMRYDAWWWLEWSLHGRLGRTARALAEPVRLLGSRPHLDLRAVLRPPLSAIEANVPAWIDRDFARRSGLADRSDRVPLFGRDAGARAVASHVQWPTLFRRADPAFHGLGLKLRHPLMDLRILAFVCALAPDPWLLDKRIMREAARGRLPEVVLQRRKTPLVVSPRPAKRQDAVAVQRLAAASPDIACRFFATDGLVGAARRPAPGAGRAEILALSRAAGLLYWLHHRTEGYRVADDRRSGSGAAAPPVRDTAPGGPRNRP